MNRLAMLSTFFKVGLLFLSIVSLVTLSTKAQENSTVDIDIPPLIIGNMDSEVHLVEFVSYTCPHCAKFHIGSFEELKADYINSGLIQFEIREVIWDAPSWIVSVVGRCGNIENYFNFIDLVFEKQREWTSLGTQGEVAQRIKSMAVSVGYDGNEIDECFQNQDYHNTLLQHSQEMVKKSSISSTPSFLLNESSLGSYDGYDELVSAIEKKLDR